MASDRRHGFGHPPAIAGQRAKFLADLANQFGRSRSAAIGYRFKAGEIVILALRMLKQLPGYRRHTSGRIDLFALDDLERLNRVPSVHENQRISCSYAPHQTSRTCGNVEKGYNGQANFLDRVRQGITAPKHCAGTAISAGHDVGAKVAMRAKRTFRIAGRTASIEDRRIIIWQDFYGRQGPSARHHRSEPWFLNYQDHKQVPSRSTMR